MVMNLVLLYLLSAIGYTVGKDLPKDHRQTSKFNKIPLPWQYPKAVPDAKYYDLLHGVGVRDPYHYFEDHRSPVTREFWQKNNELLDKYLGQNPHQKVIHDNMVKLYSPSVPGNPVKHGDYYYYTERASLQGNAVLYRKKNLDDEPQVVLDPNPLSPDETAFINFFSFSENKEHLVISTARKGSDWKSFTVYQNDSELNELETLLFTQDSSVVWSKDNKGFFYSKDPEPKGFTLDELGLDANPSQNNKLYYHKIGTKQSEDILIWEDNSNPNHSASVGYAGKDDEFMILQVYRSTAELTKTFYADASESNVNGVIKPLTFKNIIDDFDGITDYIESVDNSTHLFYATRNAPYKKIIKASLDNINESEDYLPEQKGYGLVSATLGKSKILASYIKDSKYYLRVYDKTNPKELIKSVELPIGGLKTFKLDTDETSVSLNMTDFFYATKTYSFNITSDSAPTLTYKSPSLPGFNPDLFETSLTHYESKDGTKVPITLAHKKGLKLNGKTPVYLYGYGGFNIINTPAPREHWLAMLQSLDMVIAIAHIRGGGENGSPWSTTGSRLSRQNSYDDFQYAAKYLVKEKYTSHDLIVINGRSNGGALSGVSLVQAPELFGAVVADVGVLDMTRFQRFTDGVAWFEDFGDAINNATEFKNILKYSPYHNIKSCQPYPPTLITSGTHDDRVSTLHSLKFAARIQHLYKYHKHPVFLQVTNNTGHGCGGCGKPIGLEISDKTKMLSFISMVFNIEPKAL